MKLILVRHGESRGNASGDYSIELSDSLSPAGTEQAETLAGRLAGYPIDHVIVSPLTRALQTAAPYLRTSGKKGEVWPELSEACWQEPAFETADSFSVEPAEIPDDLKELYFFRDGNEVLPIDETYAKGIYRVGCAVSLLETYKEKPVTVLAVAHGHLIREVLIQLIKPEHFTRFPHDNCGMTFLEYDECWIVRYINRISG